MCPSSVHYIMVTTERKTKMFRVFLTQKTGCLLVRWRLWNTCHSLLHSSCPPAVWGQQQTASIMQHYAPVAPQYLNVYSNHTDCSTWQNCDNQWSPPSWDISWKWNFDKWILFMYKVFVAVNQACILISLLFATAQLCSLQQCYIQEPCQN